MKKLLTAVLFLSFSSVLFGADFYQPSGKMAYYQTKLSLWNEGVFSETREEEIANKEDPEELVVGISRFLDKHLTR